MDSSLLINKLVGNLIRLALRGAKNYLRKEHPRVTKKPTNQCAAGSESLPSSLPGWYSCDLDSHQWRSGKLS